MTLRNKVLAITGLTILALVLILYALSQTILGDSFKDLEEREARQVVERVLNAVSDDIEELSDTVGLAVRWSGVSNYVEMEQESDVSKLIVEGLISQRANVFAIVDLEGNVVFSKAVDLSSLREVDIPLGLKEHLASNDLAIDADDINSSAQGVITLPEGPMLFAARLVLGEVRGGTIGGALFQERFLDSAKVQELAREAQVPLVLNGLADPEVPAGVRDEFSSTAEGPSTAVRPLDSDVVSGYALLRDVYGSPALVLRADMPRDIYGRGQSTMRYFLLSVLVAGLAFGGVMAWLLHSVVLSRLAKLGVTVKQVGATGDTSARVSMPGNDELADLGRQINGMLDALDRSQTRLKQHEERLARSNHELEQFAYVVSHDLQEPLRKVQAFGDLLDRTDGDELSEQGRDSLDRMRDAAHRLRTLIDNLLAYSRVTTQGQPFVQVDLAETAREVLSDLEMPINDSGGRVEVGGLATIEADPMQMRQLLQNLISNGLKFRRPEEPPLLVIDGRRLNGHNGQRPEDDLYELTIKDNGIGFDEKYADRIFTVFQRLHGRSEYEGTGIGLAICRRIAERHRGTITARSKPDEGATFVVTLPLEQTQGEDRNGP